MRRADPAAETAQERVGTLLNEKWQIDALLGRGGMATVYAATNRSTRARVAVKVLLLEFAQDFDVRERFVREARIANSIQHPATVAVLDEGLSDRGEIFLVMELLEGTTLDAFIRERASTVTLADKLAFFDPVLDVLGECHAAGIIHRDIKPANIFLTSAGQIKVLDFGIARLRESKSAVEATKQGTVLGTPAFMAPEQALGLSDLVDGRADLWSVGACLYTLISGQRVHRARSENESMVLAATKAADSLAVAMPDLPVEVVAFVDKSLAHDRTHRFSDARAMRGALGALLAGIRTGQVTVAKRRGGDAVVVRTEVTRDTEADESTELRNESLEGLKSIWRHLSQFLASSGQYGPTHSLALQPMRVALEEIGARLAARPNSLSWDVGPYAFTYAKTPLWDSEKVALERISFHVFSHGLRRIQFKPGLTEDELRRFLAILTRDRASGIALTDDPVADLWAQKLEHVGHLAIDAFASGTADEVDAFEGETDAVAQQAVAVSMVSKGWDDEKADSLEARAMQANLLSGLNAAAEVAASIAIDAATRMLGGQVVLSSMRWDERFLEILVTALKEGARAGDADVALHALSDWAGSFIGRGALTTVFERFARIGATGVALLPAEDAAELERTVARAMFDRAKLADVLNRVRAATSVTSSIDGSKGDGSRGDGSKGDGTKGTSADRSSSGAPTESPVVPGLEHVLGLLEDDSFFDVAVDQWLGALDARIARALFAYLSRWVSGHEAKLGAVIESEPAPFALAVLDLLKDLTTKEAATAVAAGLRSPHADVRRAALQNVRGEEAQADLQRLLGDPARDLRRDVLAIVAKLRLRAVGPTLVRRIQEPSFQTLEMSERREWLTSLHVLNATRAEEIAIEMLSNAPLVPNEANDRNRLLAAQVLATADTVKALDAVKTAARKVWWNSQAVRQAADEAIVAISGRLAGKGQQA